MWRGAKLRINTGWTAAMMMSTLLVLVLLFIAADLCQIRVILIYFFQRGKLVFRKVNLTHSRSKSRALTQPLTALAPKTRLFSVHNPVSNRKQEVGILWVWVLPYYKDLKGVPRRLLERAEDLHDSATTRHSNLHPIYLKVEIIHWEPVPR